MSTAERILIAVDDSEASVKAVAYAGRLLSGNSSCRVRLFHIVEPIGPSWTSLHGDFSTESQAPASEPEALLIKEASRRSRPVLESMLKTLTTAGLQPALVESSWFVASREDSLALEILELAREQAYHTVVVGRASLPWYRELFHQHLGERLVKKGEGLSVWVIE